MYLFIRSFTDDQCSQATSTSDTASVAPYKWHCAAPRTELSIWGNGKVPDEGAIVDANAVRDEMYPQRRLFSSFFFSRRTSTKPFIVACSAEPTLAHLLSCENTEGANVVISVKVSISSTKYSHAMIILTSQCCTASVN